MTNARCLGYADIPYDPPRAPDAWCDEQPCLDLGGIILSQPLSTVIVYATAVITVLAGVYFWQTRENHRSRVWLGAAFLLLGVGAALAGTSYQAFGYEIKCRGRETCAWTSWWELAYMATTVVGVGAMLVAIAYVALGKRGQVAARWYAIANGVGYLVLLDVGAVIPVQFLITFEMMLIFVLPVYATIVVVSLRVYLTRRETLARQLFVACLLLGIAIEGYYAYYLLGITGWLWARGVWFSDNDVLHLLMIVWIIYVYRALGPVLQDGALKS